MPVGITALLIGVLLVFFGIFKPDDVAKAFAKDAVIFVFGVLAMSKAITKTGLDRRIGILLLGPAQEPPAAALLLPAHAVDRLLLRQRARAGGLHGAALRHGLRGDDP